MFLLDALHGGQAYPMAPGQVPDIPVEAGVPHHLPAENAAHEFAGWHTSVDAHLHACASEWGFGSKLGWRRVYRAFAEVSLLEESQ